LPPTISRQVEGFLFFHFKRDENHMDVGGHTDSNKAHIQSVLCRQWFSTRAERRGAAAIGEVFKGD